MSQGIGVDLTALSAYGSAAGGLASEVGAVGTSTLAQATSLPGDCFGQIGNEVGLNAAFQQAAQAQLDGIKAASAGLGGLATAVTKARDAYVEQEAQHKTSIERTYQV